MEQQSEVNRMSDDLISRQAAIDALGDMVMNWTDSEYELGQLNQWKADRKAIIDLPSAQPQPCKDAVSKADVLETYAELYDIFDDNKEIKNELHKIYDKINALQAEQPQRIKGKWKRKESDLSWWYECSECGESPLFDPYEHEVRTPFCPWCGADMRGNKDAVD